MLIYNLNFNVVQADVTYIVNDDFNNEPTGGPPNPANWTVTKTGNGSFAIKEVPSATNKSLSLYTASSSDVAEADRINFGGLTGRVAVEFDVMTTGTKFSCSPYIYNNAGKAVIKIGLRDGYILAIAGSGQTNTVPFVANKWYHLKIIVNSDTNTYDFWVDGVKQTLLFNDLTQKFDGITNLNITKIMFKADNNSTSATGYIDNLQVYIAPPAQITGINFNPASYNFYPGDTMNTVVWASDTDQNLSNVTSGCSFISAATNVAVVDATGKITAVGEGTTEIRATYNTFSASATVNVLPVPSLSVPSGLTVGMVRSTSVALSWSTVLNANNYNIYRAPAGSGQYTKVGQSTNFGQPTKTVYIDNDVAANTAYDYRVASVFKSVNQVFESTQSNNVTVITTAPLINLPPVSALYKVRDDFNSDITGSAPDGWVTNGAVSIQEVPFPADKSVKVYNSDGTSAVSATRTFSDLSGTVTVEAKVSTNETTGIKYAPSILSSSGAVIAAVAFTNGNIAYNKAGVLTTIQSFSANKYYIVRLVLDTAANKYDLYIDGLKKVTAASVVTPSASIGKLVFSIGSGNIGTLNFDNIKVYTLPALSEVDPSLIFDVKNYGAKGDGVTKDTSAIQAAINACAGTGGYVYLHDGTFLSGMIQLKSNMTFYLDATATLLGSTTAADYPDKYPLTDNYQLCNTRKALIFAENAENVNIDGGGTIDGSGGSFTTGAEYTRPIAIWTALCYNVSMQNIYIRKSAMWTVVNLETDYLTINNLYLDVNLSSNRDGIDTVDCKHVIVQDCTVNTGDDAICIKSGKRRGLDDLLVKNCNVTASSTNGLKFGTASYGAFRNITFQDCMVKGVKYAAMAVESVDGAAIYNVIFQRIDFQDVGNPFWVILGNRGNHPDDDVPRIGSIDTIRFQDIIGKKMKNTWGSPISGTIVNGTTYKVKNVYFNNVNITYLGGKTIVPVDPPEYIGQYPESNIWGDLPAYGYFIRHVDGLSFTNCTTNVSPTDVRNAIELRDVTQLNTPVNVNVVAGSTTVTVSWDTVPWATGYEVEADGHLNSIVNNTLFIHSGLIPKTEHVYRVRAIQGDIRSEWSNIVKATTVNGPPVFDPISDQSVNEGQPLQFSINATDPGDDPLTYSAGNLPFGASFYPVTKTFNWTPSYTEAGDYVVHFTVSDGNLSDGKDVTITVVNVPPSQLINNLIVYIQSLNLPKGTGNSLTAKLNNATKSLENGKADTAINQINAFINEVQAQTGKEITQEQADVMISGAKTIIYVIGL